MAQITQVCKYLILTILLFQFKLSGATDLRANNFGSFLSWNYAKQNSDLNNQKYFYPNVDLKKVDKKYLEELLIDSMIFNDWDKSNLISTIILDRDKTNILANFFQVVENFLISKPIDKYLNEINPQYFDSNFVRAINIWSDFNKKSNLSVEDECIPIICLHAALFYKKKNNNKKKEFFFQKIINKDFVSLRLKEILLLNSLETNNEKSALKINKELQKANVNFQKYDEKFLKINKQLLNPINNEKEGLAEVFYNISSWYYSNDLYKYSIFFGKLSIRLRQNFNSMKILLAGSLSQMNLEELGLQELEKLNHKNIYYLKMLKMRLAFFEKLGKTELFLSEIVSFTTKFPDEIEMKVLLADKFRQTKKYEEAIRIYTQVIDSDSLLNKSNILYSRGISYERLNRWNRAEQDFKTSLNLNPEDPYVMNYLAYSWLDREVNIPKALKLLIRAVEIEPTDAYIRDSLGWAYYLAKNFEESITHLEKAVVMLPDDATLNDHLGDAYWMSNRKSEAKSQWKKVLNLEPDYKEKENIKKKLSRGL